MRQQVGLDYTGLKCFRKEEETAATWPQTQDEPAVRIRVWQNREEAQVQNMFNCGRFQVLEHFWPSFAACVVVEQQLQSAVIIKLPGPQEAKKKGIIQPGPKVGLFLKQGWNVQF